MLDEEMPHPREHIDQHQTEEQKPRFALDRRRHDRHRGGVRPDEVERPREPFAVLAQVEGPKLVERSDPSARHGAEVSASSAGGSEGAGRELPQVRGGAARFLDLEVDAHHGHPGHQIVDGVRAGVTGGIVKPEAFTLVAGEDSLSSYEWGHKVSRRFFCRHCGIHCFGRGYLVELGGDFVSVNYNCLENVELSELKVGYWDGRHNNWYAGLRDRPWPILTPAPLGPFDAVAMS